MAPTRQPGAPCLVKLVQLPVVGADTEDIFTRE